MSPLFNMLSRLVLTFLPRSKHLLISWLQSPSAVIFSSVQFSRSVMSDSLRLHESQHARPPCPSPEFTQSHIHRVGDAIQPSHPLSSPSPAFNLPSIRVFSSELALHIRWPKKSFSISSSNEYSGLISFRIDWFDLLAVQGTLKTLLQHHSLTA